MFCHPELGLLYCIAVLCDYCDSQVQGSCYREWIGGACQICKILKPGEIFSSWRN